MTAPALAPEVLARLQAAAGAGGWTTDPAVIAPHLSDWRGRAPGATPLMLRPDSTAAVQRIVTVAAETRTPLVPQGGNTGLVAGQIPQGQILLCLGRLSRVRSIDPANDTLTVEAGVTLAAAQRAAAAAGRLFPLSLAAEESATIGGVLSTNAGGTAVVRYGTARALCLGVEAVLPDGGLFSALSGLRKDNTGYDLSQLLIGAEGTLGVITAATLRLFPAPRARATAFLSVPDPAAAVTVLRRLQASCGDALSAFELVSGPGLGLVCRHVPEARLPFGSLPDWAVLVEVASAADLPLEDLLLAGLAEAESAGEVREAVLARSERARAEFWRLRESLSAAQRADGPSLKHDVSVPVSRIADFIAAASAAVAACLPAARVIAFGHVGDGNVHFNVSAPPQGGADAFATQGPRITEAVHAAVAGHGGSISAEHGIGRAKAGLLAQVKAPAALAAMRAVKRALDPHGIMNPGALLLP